MFYQRNAAYADRDAYKHKYEEKLTEIQSHSTTFQQQQRELKSLKRGLSPPDITIYTRISASVIFDCNIAFFISIRLGVHGIPISAG